MEKNLYLFISFGFFTLSILTTAEAGVKPGRKWYDPKAFLDFVDLSSGPHQAPYTLHVRAAQGRTDSKINCGTDAYLEKAEALSAGERQTVKQCLAAKDSQVDAWNDQNLATGSVITAHYQWNFGDPKGIFNKPEGFSAAHTFNSPGKYTVSLRVTNDRGHPDVKRRTIVIAPNTRYGIYVSNSYGNDKNPGTINQPVKTFARAYALYQSHPSSVAVYFQRGDTFMAPQTFNLNGQNILIGVYGKGQRPKIRTQKVKDLFSSTNEVFDVVFQSLDVSAAPGEPVPYAIHLRGPNITVFDSVFNHVDHVVNGDHGSLRFYREEHGSQ